MKNLLSWILGIVLVIAIIFLAWKLFIGAIKAAFFLIMLLPVILIIYLIYRWFKTHST